MDLHPPRLDPGHVEQLGDEPGDPVRVGVDGFQHHFLLVVGEPAPFGQQRGGEAFHAGQRGPQLVRHGGHQIGAAALQAGPLLRTAQHEHQALDLAAPASRVALPRCGLGRGGGAGASLGRGGGAEASRARCPHVRHRDQQLGSVAEEQRHLGVAGADGQPVVGVGRPPPAAPVGVTQREDLPHVRADRGPDGCPGQPRGGAVEHHDPASVVGDHQAVRKFVGTGHRADQHRTRRHLAGQVGRPARAHGSRQFCWPRPSASPDPAAPPKAPPKAEHWSSVLSPGTACPSTRVPASVRHLCRLSWPGPPTRPLASRGPPPPATWLGASCRTLPHMRHAPARSYAM